MATNETIRLRVSENMRTVPLENESDNSPYYVGARAYVTQLEDGAEITVIDKEGTTTATVHDGDTGADGYSPTATVSKSGGTTTITITDKNGTTTAEVHDGVDSVTDVKVDGSSVVSSGVATIPKASANAYGVVKVEPPTDTPDAYPTENDRIYAMIFSDDGEVSRVPTLVKTTGLLAPKYLPKATMNKYGVVKAGYDGNPPAGYLYVAMSGQYISEVCVPVLETNYTPDSSGTIRPRHLPDATTTAKGAMSASDKAKLDSIGSGVPDGGTTGQVLSKASGTDYDLEWVTPSGGDVTDVQVDGTSIVDSDGIAVLETVTQLRDGLMTASDKQKLDGVESGAEVNLVDDVQVDGTSVVSGGVAEIDLTGKSDVGHTHTKSAITDFPTDVSSFVNDSGYITSPNVVYCTCSTAAGTTAKVATIVEGTLSSLTAGAQAIVNFTNANGKANPTLKIGDTEAKPIMRYGTTAPSTSAASSWNAGSCVLFIYDGTYWQMANYLNTTYSEISEANITNGSGSSSGLVTGRRAKKAVETFAPIKDVTVDGISVLSGTTAAIRLRDAGYITADDLATPTFRAADATSQAVLQQAFGVTAEIVVPSNLTSTTALLYKLEPRTWFAWMNGTELEFARLSVSVNTRTSTTTLYLRGRTSIATGIMGVDSSWTVTPLATDAEGVAY